MREADGPWESNLTWDMALASKAAVVLDERATSQESGSEKGWNSQDKGAVLFTVGGSGSIQGGVLHTYRQGKSVTSGAQGDVIVGGKYARFKYLSSTYTYEWQELSQFVDIIWRGNKYIGCAKNEVDLETIWLCLYRGDGKTSSRVELTLSAAWGGMEEKSQVGSIGRSEAVKVCGVPLSEVQLVQDEVGSGASGMDDKSSAWHRGRRRIFLEPIGAAFGLIASRRA